MGNKESNVYLASPAAVALSALAGEIVDTRGIKASDSFPYKKDQSTSVTIGDSDNRKSSNVWAYTDVDNLNTDQMFAGTLTYNVLSSEGDKILPHLFKGFDDSFAEKVEKDDIILAGDNFGCGSSREHPAVGLSYAGVKAVICKSVNRIFFRSSVNQGLPIIILPEAVDSYKKGDTVDINFETGTVVIGGNEYGFAPLPEKLMGIFNAKGLVNFIKSST